VGLGIRGWRWVGLGVREQIYVCLGICNVGGVGSGSNSYWILCSAEDHLYVLGMYDRVWCKNNIMYYLTKIHLTFAVSLLCMAHVYDTLLALPFTLTQPKKAHKLKNHGMYFMLCFDFLCVIFLGKLELTAALISIMNARQSGFSLNNTINFDSFSRIPIVHPRALGIYYMCRITIL